jgi:hypothetical protein
MQLHLSSPCNKKMLKIQIIKPRSLIVHVCHMTLNASNFDLWKIAVLIFLFSMPLKLCRFTLDVSMFSIHVIVSKHCSYSLKVAHAVSIPYYFCLDLLWKMLNTGGKLGWVIWCFDRGKHGLCYYVGRFINCLTRWFNRGQLL